MSTEVSPLRQKLLAHLLTLGENNTDGVSPSELRALFDEFLQKVEVVVYQAHPRREQFPKLYRMSSETAIKARADFLETARICGLDFVEGEITRIQEET